MITAKQFAQGKVYRLVGETDKRRFLLKGDKVQVFDPNQIEIETYVPRGEERFEPVPYKWRRKLDD